MQWEYYVVYCVAVQIEYMENIWQRLIEAIQELICLKGVLLIEIGIHLVDPITFMDVKSAIILANTRMRMGRSILNTVSRGHGSR